MAIKKHSVMVPFEFDDKPISLEGMYPLNAKIGGVRIKEIRHRGWYAGDDLPQE